MPDQSLIFPPEFLWGVSTSAHQVEGNNHNQWTEWEAAGKTVSGDRSGIACDWWNNAERDFDLARELGVNALRLSVEWSRIEPEPGSFSQPAIERYREMLSGLRSRGIKPLVTLHHFTNPIWFEDTGAFLSTESAIQFERFVHKVVVETGDLCDTWITFNEPNVYSTLGYLVGEFPPGRRSQLGATITVLANIARAHARAYRAIHELQPHAQVGWTDNYIVFHPANPESRLDRMVAGWQHHLFNSSFLRVIERGALLFPFSLLSGDLQEVKGTCDFVGINVYNRAYSRFDLRFPASLFGHIFIPDDVPQGDPGVNHPYGEAYPHAIYLAAHNAARLGKPIYILENGVPDAQDRIRPWLIANAVRELHALIQQGIDVRGYFHWSLVDNFEWSEGWRLRFGLYALDRETQQRIARPSAQIYSAIAKANGLTEEPNVARLHLPQSVSSCHSHVP
jgi:beta-glucosidase